MSQNREKKDSSSSFISGSMSGNLQRPNSSTNRSSFLKAQGSAVRISGGRPSSFAQIGRSSRTSTGTRHRGDKTGGMDFSAQQALVTIYDADGNDVTPKPLLSMQRPTLLKGAGIANSTPENSTPTSEVSDSAGGRKKESYRGPASLSGSEGTITPDRVDEEAEVEDRLIDSELIDIKVEIERPAHIRSSNLNEDDLDDKVYLTLSETDTFTLLHMPSRCVHVESAEAAIVEEANSRYQNILDTAEGSDTLTTNEAQTLNLTMKSREVQVSAQEESSVTCQVTLWDININEGKDGNSGAMSMKTNIDIEERRIATASEKLKPDSSFGGDGFTTSRRGSGAGIDGDEDDGVSGSNAVNDGKSFTALNNIPGLYRALRIVERAVTQNTYNSHLLLYRNYKSRNASNKEETIDSHPSLTHLWSFNCELTKGRNISSMCWNKYKRDLLVVGYGQFQFGFTKGSSHVGGLIAFWSLKNPEYPEWTFSTSSPITALDFSAIHPNLLAVGFYDGSVAIYDVRSPESSPKPVLESTWSSSHNSGKHSDPVWRLQWGDSNSERGETLVSISTDGRVTQWSIKKGLEHTDLMRLKRISRSTKGSNKNEAFISRRSSGMCLDFSPRDSSMYIAGTEDGTIHKCSCSYAEQYLESFFGHTGPVYQVAWSPFSPSLFLSCSADWTIRLWSEDQSSALLTLQSGNESVSDIAWLPNNSTVFGAVTGNGKLEVWDLSESILKPQVSHSFTSTSGGSHHVSLSKLLFSLTAPVVVCGGSDGAVHVLRHSGLDKTQYSSMPNVKEDFAKSLDDAVRSSVQQSNMELN